MAAHFRAGDFLDSPPVQPDAAATVAVGDTAPDLPPDTVLGPYRLRKKIGEGGMGVVYVAEQTTPVRRRVALKVIKLGMDTKEVVARFEVERQALALMDHPNIARVFDGGVHDGRPYFVMELDRRGACSFFPAPPQHFGKKSLWIIDSGTDAVYEYADARSRTSGSQSAAATFALAAGNTNPLGIADPPPAGGPTGPLPTLGEPTSLLSVALPGNLMERAWELSVDASRGGSGSPRVTPPVAFDQPLAEGAGLQRSAERPASDTRSHALDDKLAFTPMFAPVDADTVLEPGVGRVVTSRW